MKKALLLAALVVAGCSGSQRSGGTLPASSTAPGSTPIATTPVVSSATTAPATTTLTPTGRRCWPIVLVHGIAGWSSIFGFDYFQGVAATLRANGFSVYTVSLSPINTVEARGRQLRDEILLQYPDPRVKVNILAHSMGGLDARYAITTLGFGDRVATLATMGTPHQGTIFADLTLGLLPGQWIQAANNAVAGLGIDIRGVLELSKNYTAAFNARTPDDPRVAYFSWAGVADPGGKQTGAPLQAALYPTWYIETALEGANDGIVPEASAHWGTFLGTVNADHAQEVGLYPGTTSPVYDQRAFFESWAEDLERRGFGP